MKKEPTQHQVISFIFLFLSIYFWLLYFHLILPVGGAPLSIVVPCAGLDYSISSGNERGLPNTFLVNDAVNLSISISESSSCNETYIKNSIKLHLDDYTFDANETGTYSIPLDTSIQKSPEYRQFWITWVRYDGTPFTSKKTTLTIIDNIENEKLRLTKEAADTSTKQLFLASVSTLLLILFNFSKIKKTIRNYF